MGANNKDSNNNSNDGHDMLKTEDKKVKMGLFLETITKQCASSSHPTLEKINNAIGSPESGKLDAVVLSGGYTNYSYKVFVENQPELCVFAKLCFEFALW